MTSFYADMKLMAGSADILSSLSKLHDPELLNTIHSQCKSIIEVGSKHDNCFASLSTSDIESSINNYSEDLLQLSCCVEDTMDRVFDYSVNGGGDLELFDKKYSITHASIKSLECYVLRIFEREGTLADKLSSHQITANYDSEYYDKLLNDLLANSSSQRDKVVNAAIFMSSVFPHLPYFWGGGHSYNQEGVDPSWGSIALVTAEGDATSGTYIPYSMDCSGYVDWLFYNSGVSTDRADYLSLVGDYDSMGSRESIKAPGISSRVKPGDLAEMDGHVGVVVAVQDNNVIVSHCCGSGNGMSYTAIDMNTGLVSEDSSKPDRKGEEYFTDIIHIDYDDESEDDEEKEKE